MALTDHQISENSPIRALDEAAINRIAAGEVVERPASAVKELIENAIDAGATRITVDVADGGKTLIRITDDGRGIAPDQLALAVSRHATSKIDGSDLLNIHTFGFRGEALASLGAVGRLKITSHAPGEDAAEITVTGGRTDPVRPAALSAGTVVELSDLFHATPARLKFLKSDRAEQQALSETVKRLAMAEPYIGFVLRDLSGGGERVIFRCEPEMGEPQTALKSRLTRVMGAEFTENSLAVEAEKEGYHLTGFAGLPTYSRGAAVAQFLFVNGRPVKDRMLMGALRGAYADVLPSGRHPAAALYVDCDPRLVDVNVHPAKTEVRFRTPGAVRSLIVNGVRDAIHSGATRTSSTVADDTLKAMEPAPRVYQMDRTRSAPIPRSFAEAPQPFAPSARAEPEPEAPADAPLGAARAQVHGTYIIAQTEDGVVIVDQHAAHERLIYEDLKAQMAENGVAAQALLIPEIVELPEDQAQTLLNLADVLSRLGLTLEAFGPGAIAVQETPAVLGPINAGALLKDVLDELDGYGGSDLVQEKIEAVLSRVACHGSIRAGRQMRADEMNALLRQMEATPLSGQCNHGRPTYVELKLSDIERLFGRS